MKVAAAVARAGPTRGSEGETPGKHTVEDLMRAQGRLRGPVDRGGGKPGSIEDYPPGLMNLGGVDWRVIPIPVRRIRVWIGAMEEIPFNPSQRRLTKPFLRIRSVSLCKCRLVNHEICNIETHTCSWIQPLTFSLSPQVSHFG